MTNIIFIQNKDSRLWAVKDNLTGDLKGLITERFYTGLNQKSYSVYEFCYFDKQFGMQLDTVDELLQVQEFLLDYFKSEEL